MKERKSMKERLKASIDLTRAHFFPIWPLLFCSGLFLAFRNYGGFSWSLTIKAALIGLFGLEAGLVLNDYVDRDRDRRDVEPWLTRYWRLFKERPIPSGFISLKTAFKTFLFLTGITSVLIFTLPYPNSLYVFAIMLYAYGIEVFYQVKKRRQKYPLAQLLGRTDLAFFPAAGYLCYGQPDMTALFYILFFYPWTMAHLAVNDLADFANDQARGMKSLAVLYGIKGTLYWITGFTLVHFLFGAFFIKEILNTGLHDFIYGFLLGFLLLLGANIYLLRKKSPEAGLKMLPFFHGTLLIYVVSIILSVYFGH